VKLEVLSKNLKKLVWDRVKKKKNVVGFSGRLLPKIKNGKITDQLAIRIYVSKKLPRSQLLPEDLIPEKISFKNLSSRSKITSIPTDVVEIGEIKALGFRDRIRPPVAGISAMGYWKGSTACTLGFFAKNKAKNEEEFIGILCNNHCGAHENKARLGTPYLQPSPYDGGKLERDRIGFLWRYVPIRFEEFTCPYRNFFYRLVKPFLGYPENKVDIAFIKPTVEIKTEIFKIGQVYGKRRPRFGEKVQKMGRTTGHTTDGIVIDLDWNGRVSYSRGTAFFTDCVLISKEGFSAGGDSSSPIVSMDEKPDLLAILFAGSQTHTIGCYIDNIERELEVEVYPFK